MYEYASAADSSGGVACPARAQEGDNLRFSPSCESSSFPWRVWRKPETGDRCEIGVRQSGYRCVAFSAFSQFTDSVLLHRSATSNRRDITVSRNSLARCNARHLRIKHSVPFISVGPVYHNALTCCAALSCRTLRKENHLCSSTVSDTANMRIHERSQAVSAEEKILCRFPFSQRSHVGNLRQTIPKETGRKSEGWKPWCPSLLCARAASAQFRSLHKRKLRSPRGRYAK